MLCTGNYTKDLMSEIHHSDGFEDYKWSKSMSLSTAKISLEHTKRREKE